MLRNNILMRIAAVILGIAIFSNVGYGSIDYVTCRADDYTQECYFFRKKLCVVA